MITTIKQATHNILSRLDWKVYKTTLFSFITFLFIIPCVIFLPERFAWENSLLENIQLGILAIGFIFAIKAKWNKKLFNFVAMILFILFLREINCGRVFFPIQNTTNSFYQWKDILNGNYRYLPNTLYGLFIVYTIYYFFKNKLILTVLNYIKSVKIEMIDSLFLLIGIVFGSVSEMGICKYYWCEMLEEMTETLFYVALVSLIYIYSHEKNFKL